jgi:hypothetical protein
MAPRRHAIFERWTLLPCAVACHLLLLLLSSRPRSLSAGSGSWLI